MRMKQCAALLLAALLFVCVVPAAMGETETQTAVITIKNGAASANTTEAVNGLHVYCPDTEEKDDYADGAEEALGTNVTLFVYNLASPVHLTVLHNGETVADKNYPVLESDEQVEKIQLTLAGDLSVTTEAIEEFTVKVTNRVQSDAVLLVVRTLDAEGMPVDVEDGALLEKGALLFVQVINASEQAVTVSAIANGTTVDSAVIDAKPADDDASYGGLMGVELSDNMEMVLE